jgi:selenoprotein W-related protein
LNFACNETTHNKAASFAEDLFNHFYRDIQKVTVNGEKIYLKLETGMFPDSEEMIEIIAAKQEKTIGD